MDKNPKGGPSLLDQSLLQCPGAFLKSTVPGAVRIQQASLLSGLLFSISLCHTFRWFLGERKI